MLHTPIIAPDGAIIGEVNISSRNIFKPLFLAISPQINISITKSRNQRLFSKMPSMGKPLVES